MPKGPLGRASSAEHWELRFWRCCLWRPSSREGNETRLGARSYRLRRSCLRTPYMRCRVRRRRLDWCVGPLFLLGKPLLTAQPATFSVDGVIGCYYYIVDTTSYLKLGIFVAQKVQFHRRCASVSRAHDAGFWRLGCRFGRRICEARTHETHTTTMAVGGSSQGALSIPMRALHIESSNKVIDELQRMSLISIHGWLCILSFRNNTLLVGYSS